MSCGLEVMVPFCDYWLAQEPYPMVRLPAYRLALNAQVEEPLNGDGPALPLLDTRAIRGLLLDARVERRFPREGLELILDLDQWLRIYRPGRVM